MSSSCRDRLQQILATPQVAATLSTTGHGMILALKYVLPKLLIGPVYHCFSYFKYIELFKDLTTSDEDKESFEQAEGLLAPLKNDLEKVCKRSSKSGIILFNLN
jgi:son of sevenless-like protein